MRRIGGLAANRPGVRRRPRDQRGAALGEHALARVDVVLEAHARVTAQAHRQLGHRALRAPGGCDAPGRARRQERAEEVHDVLSRRNGALHAEDELEVQGGCDHPFGGEGEGFLDVADLVAFELGDGARGSNRGRELADVGPAVDEDVVPEVDRAAVQRRHLRAAREGAGPLRH
jgi:hypothetical protein